MEKVITGASSHALTHFEGPTAATPPRVYLAGLSSGKSRRAMGSALMSMANLLGYAHFDEIPWAALSRHLVIALMVKLEGLGRTPNTRRMYLSALKGVAREAWHAGLLDVDTYQQIKDVRGAKGSRLPAGRALPAAEIEELLNTCRADERPQGVRDVAIIEVLFLTGVRRSELVSLDLTSADFAEHEIRLIGKGNKERLAPINERVIASLRRWLAIRGEAPGPLFVRIRKGGQITTDRLSDHAVFKILEWRYMKAGTDKVRPHDIRRSLINMLLENGEDISTVQEVVGHADIRTTKRYDRTAEKRKKKAIHALGF